MNTCTMYMYNTYPFTTFTTGNIPISCKYYEQEPEGTSMFWHTFSSVWIKSPPQLHYWRSWILNFVFCYFTTKISVDSANFLFSAVGPVVIWLSHCSWANLMHTILLPCNCLYFTKNVYQHVVIFYATCTTKEASAL